MSAPDTRPSGPWCACGEQDARDREREMCSFIHGHGHRETSSKVLNTVRKVFLQLAMRKNIRHKPFVI
jgi:hypothetical protein